MTEGPILAKNFFLFQNGVAYGCETDVEISIDKEMIELACKDGKSKKPGDTSMTGSASGLAAYDHALGVMDAAQTLDDGDEVVIRFTTNEVDDKYLEFNAFISNVTMSGGVDGGAIYSLSFVDSDGTLYSDSNPQV